MHRTQSAGLWPGAIAGVSVVVAHDLVRHFFHLPSQRAIALAFYILALSVFGFYRDGSLLTRPVRAISIIAGLAAFGAVVGYAW